MEKIKAIEAKRKVQRKQRVMDSEKNIPLESFMVLCVTWAHSNLGIPPSFFRRITTDDDWTVVIKLHAVIEAGLNRLILSSLKDERLSDIVSGMDTGDRDHGKLAFVKTMELLPTHFRRFITIMSKLRNKLVHNVKNIDFSFVEWISKMDDAELKQLRDTLRLLSIKQSPTPSALSCDDIKNDPRNMMLYGCLILMVMMLKQEFAPDDPNWPDFEQILSKTKV